mmetsp:Transcript_37838/g.97888  ORF Transcript_37838/g.97888 Transcript_37838/m.97888 type:complete len:205 (-) Transcript_37838:9-623(-)
MAMTCARIGTVCPLSVCALKATTKVWLALLLSFSCVCLSLMTACVRRTRGFVASMKALDQARRSRMHRKQHGSRHRKAPARTPSSTDAMTLSSAVHAKLASMLICMPPPQRSVSLHAMQKAGSQSSGLLSWQPLEGRHSDSPHAEQLSAEQAAETPASSKRKQRPTTSQGACIGLGPRPRPRRPAPTTRRATAQGLRSLGPVRP